MTSRPSAPMMDRWPFHNGEGGRDFPVKPFRFPDLGHMKSSLLTPVSLSFVIRFPNLIEVFPRPFGTSAF
jgi:hypothetical protein